MLRLSDLELTPRFRLILTVLTVVLILVVTTFSLVYFFLAIQSTAVKNLNRGGKVIRVLFEERSKDLAEFTRGLADNKTLQLLLEMDMPQKVGELINEAVLSKKHHLITVYDSRLEVQADVGWTGSELTRGRTVPSPEEIDLIQRAVGYGALETVILLGRTGTGKQPVLSAVVPVNRGGRTIGYLAAHYLVQEDKDFFRTLNAILAANVRLFPASFPNLLPGVHGIHLTRPLELIRFDLFAEGLVHFQTVKDSRNHIVAVLGLHVDGAEIRGTFIAALSFYFLFSLGMMAVVMLLVTRMTSLILNPVARLLEGVARITAGNLKHEIPVAGKDEIAQLGHSFNEMRLALDSKIQEIQRLNDLKDQFLANTSHELKTPLIGMTGLLESVLADPQNLGQENIRKLNLVYTSSQRLSRLINDILDLSRLRKKELPINWSSVDIAALSLKVIGLFSSVAHGKNLTLEKPEGTILPVQGDEARLEQVLINLVGNAVKFTPQGWIKIRLLPSTEMVRIEVADSGIGIPSDRHEAVFESFSQASPEISRDYGGTGLGLTISREILQAMGSQLHLESTPGKGSNFYFDLAYAETAVSTPRTPEPLEMPKSSFPSLEGVRICAVDDEPINLEVLKAQLRTTGALLQVFTEADGALKSLGEQPVDLLIMDVMMPGRTGFEVVRQMRAGGLRIPVLFLTARNHTQDLKLCLSAGGNDIRSKPYGREELLGRLRLLTAAFTRENPIPPTLNKGTLHVLPLDKDFTFPKTEALPLAFLDRWWALWLPEGRPWPGPLPASLFALPIVASSSTADTLEVLWEKFSESLV